MAELVSKYKDRSFNQRKGGRICSQLIDCFNILVSFTQSVSLRFRQVGVVVLCSEFRNQIENCDEQNIFLL